MFQSTGTRASSRGVLSEIVPQARERCVIARTEGRPVDPGATGDLPKMFFERMRAPVRSNMRKRLPHTCRLPRCRARVEREREELGTRAYEHFSAGPAALDVR